MTESLGPGALPRLLALMSLPLVLQTALRLALWGAIPDRIPLRWEGGEVVWSAPTDAAFAVAAALALAGVGCLVVELRRSGGGRRNVLTAAGLAASLPCTVWCGSAVVAIADPPAGGVLTIVLLGTALAGAGYGLLPRAHARA